MFPVVITHSMIRRESMSSAIWCSVFLTSGQIEEIIMRQFLPFHLRLFFPYFSTSLIFLPSRSLPPSLQAVKCVSGKWIDINAMVRKGIREPSSIKCMIIEIGAVIYTRYQSVGILGSSSTQSMSSC